MSDPDPRSSSGSASRVLSILMILIGGVMLLPGICAGFFALASFGKPRSQLDYGLTPPLLPSFAVALVGLALIVWAARRLGR
jgi:hypothetical protein